MSKAGERLETARTRHIDEAVSRRFRELREAMGLTRRQVAADMGASEGRWQAYEDGARVPASRIWQFCRHYGLDVRDLYAGLPFTIGHADCGKDPGEGDGDPVAKHDLVSGMAETGAPFDPAPDLSEDSIPGDDILRAITEAAAALNPLERSLALAALRGMASRKLKQP